MLGSHLLLFNLGSWYPGKQAAGGYGEQYKKVKYYCPFWFSRVTEILHTFCFPKKDFHLLSGGWVGNTGGRKGKKKTSWV